MKRSRTSLADDLASIVPTPNQKILDNRREMVGKKQYPIPYAWRQYCWIFIFVWCLVCAILTINYGLQLDLHAHLEAPQFQASSCEDNIDWSVENAAKYSMLSKLSNSKHPFLLQISRTC